MSINKELIAKNMTDEEKQEVVAGISGRKV